MLKRFFELLGLATMGVGIYFVVSEQSQNDACNATAGKFDGLSVSTACQHVVYAYFGGFVLLVAGALVAVFGLLATRKAAKRRQTEKNPSLASQYQWVGPKTGRPPQR
jgi:drug/metabolite transporter (DMT)-like permease